METNIKRPLSVWIAQILLLLPASVLSLSLFLRLGHVVLTSAIEKRPVISIGPFLYEFGASTLLFTAVIGMAKRKNSGRWLGVAILSLNCIATIYAFVQIGFDEDYQSKLMGKMTALCIGSITTSLTLFLIHRLAFGSAANAFFAKPETTE